MCPLIHSYVSDTQQDVGLGEGKKEEQEEEGQGRTGQDRTGQQL